MNGKWGLLRLLPGVLLFSCSSPVLATQAGPGEIGWPDSLLSRLSAVALVQTLNAELLSHDSATLTLDKWCEDHHLAAPARVVAKQIQGEDKPPGPEQLQLLEVKSVSEIKYRRVLLMCGVRVLSEADNWYVPERLTPAMNRLLTQSDTSFGRVVQALSFRRRTLSVDTLWKPLPDGWEIGQTELLLTTRTLVIPHLLLQHKAVLYLTTGVPFSEVVENYTSAVLDFPAPFTK
jgi:chorismate-pyruvate lyase